MENKIVVIIAIISLLISICAVGYAVSIKDGVRGPQGIQGMQGVSGPIGSTGLTGDDGDKGSRGSSGDDGGDGNRGLTGPTGLRGLQGEPGIDGDDGSDGDDGVCLHDDNFLELESQLEFCMTQTYAPVEGFYPNFAHCLEDQRN